jgi:CheY-like chemotaxis protein
VAVASDGPRSTGGRGSRLHLMITDVVMPEMTGIELAQEVAARHPGDPHPVRDRLCR